MSESVLHALPILFVTFFSVASLLSARGVTPDSYSGPKEKLHVYLLIGQSNMAGRATLTENQTEVVNRCYLLNDRNQWEPAQHPFNRYSTIRKELDKQKLNPGYSFAKSMLSEYHNISIGLVVNARGGTKIEQWEKGSHYYKEAVRRAKQAQKSGTIKGILWHQGESNSKNPEDYLIKLTSLVVSLRNDLGIPDLPFVAGQVNDVPAINAQIAKLPQSLSSTGFVRSEGLMAYDRWHFDAESMKLLGERYAQEMLKIQSGTISPK